MAIDGLVGSIEILGENLRIDLIPRVMESGRLSCTGQDQLRVLNYSYVPRVGQAIWGGGEDVFIEPRKGIDDVRVHYQRKGYTRLIEKEIRVIVTTLDE